VPGTDVCVGRQGRETVSRWRNICCILAFVWHPWLIRQSKTPRHSAINRHREICGQMTDCRFYVDRKGFIKAPNLGHFASFYRPAHFLPRVSAPLFFSALFSWFSFCYPPPFASSPPLAVHVLKFSAWNECHWNLSTETGNLRLLIIDVQNLFNLAAIDLDGHAAGRPPTTSSRRFPRVQRLRPAARRCARHRSPAAL